MTIAKILHRLGKVRHVIDGTTSWDFPAWVRGTHHAGCPPNRTWGRQHCRMLCKCAVAYEVSHWQFVWTIFPTLLDTRKAQPLGGRQANVKTACKMHALRDLPWLRIVEKGAWKDIPNRFDKHLAKNQTMVVLIGFELVTIADRAVHPVGDPKAHRWHLPRSLYPGFCWREWGVCLCYNQGPAVDDDMILSLVRGHDT